MFTSKLLEGSCAEVARALSLSPLVTLALRVSLMILTRLVPVPKDRSLLVTIGSDFASIRVSRIRRSTSNRMRKTECVDAQGSGYTETTGTVTELRPPAALSSAPSTGEDWPIDSAATMLALK